MRFETRHPLSARTGPKAICAWCKKVRDDTGYWRQIESYVKEHSEADFSHGICPDCHTRLRADMRQESGEAKASG